MNTITKCSVSWAYLDWNGMTFSVISMRQLSSVKEFIMMQNFFRLPKIMWMPFFFLIFTWSNRNLEMCKLLIIYVSSTY